MDVYQVRKELRSMDKKQLLGLASTQRISRCLIGGRACSLHLHYLGFNFCVSEIMGEGCQVERLTKLEKFDTDQDEIRYFLPLMESMGIRLPLSRKKAFSFKIYYRDPITNSIFYLGSILERRTKERGNNLGDLLLKAVKDHSSSIKDPSMIFLLES